ncbi:NCS2 family permease [Enemella evansiae]|uniref:NCS2 family permease n=1 Tax=Enemella evansiae TaxID=2016499 RepID=UPI000B97987F|nr:NCS2 family permease [Enemella evansiae]PFG66141.1 AGZA family xanthine/uracil permease-like MFS transporter [Propionibacteriaceae bacterium ES.041]OYN94948.1 permease [Enemella evansiae]OYO04856.1 permease [Enemella evansiae]OYO06508.1 permease [Enemella evansiae]TDO86007.1 AGZA family xanthine/uracil permease-like MFS transporter [Enemella evansiae]
MSSSATQSAIPTSRLDRWFEISARGSTIGREVRGGLVTFFTMAYIIALNPLIIGTAADVNGNLITGLPKTAENIGGSIAAVAAATALIAGIMTIAMGVVGRFPLGLATGLGLNALLAFGIVRTMTWPQAMGLVVWEGILIAILVLTGFRQAVFRAVPRPLRIGIAVGLGLFIAFVGLFDAGIVRKPQGTPPVEFGINGSLLGWPMLVFVIGLVLVAVLYARKVRGALLISILVSTVLAIILEAVVGIGSMTDASGKVVNPTGWMLNVPAITDLFTLPDLSLLGRVDLFGMFTAANGFGGVLLVLLTIFSLLLADFFDTMGTVVAVGAEGGLLDAEGNPPHITGILLVDSLGAVAGGLGSVSSNTTYIESAAGVGEGARTGLASVVTGIAFLASVFLAPIVDVVPSEAATPVLVFVGFLMMAQVGGVEWDDVEQGLPAFLTLALMPFTYSISIGIGAGFITFVLLKVARGKARQVHPLMYLVAALFVIYFAQGLIGKLVG